MEDRQPPHFRCQGPREALVVWIASSVKITALRNEGSVPPKRARFLTTMGFQGESLLKGVD